MRIKSKILLITFGWLTIFASAQEKKQNIPETFIAYKTAEVMAIDGDATEMAWDKAEWTNSFIDIQGVKKPKYNTQVKMLWDDEYYYLLVKMEEPHVWGDLKQRDTVIFYNNDFEVFLDPDGDAQNYYELEINALNTVWDLFINKPYREANNVVLNDWTLTGLQSAIKVNGTLNNSSDIDQGWQLEIAMPWKAFKTAYNQNNIPRDKFWRVNFSRVNWDHDLKNETYSRKKDVKGNYQPEYNWVWSPQGVINMHLPEKWGYVYFSSKEVGQKTSFVIPKDEQIKWKLFELYRTQKEYYRAHNKWASSLAKTFFTIEGKTIQPKLESHNFGWNISVESPFSNQTLIIKEDGAFLIK